MYTRKKLKEAGLAIGKRSPLKKLPVDAYFLLKRQLHKRAPGNSQKIENRDSIPIIPLKTDHPFTTYCPADKRVLLIAA